MLLLRTLSRQCHRREGHGMQDFAAQIAGYRLTTAEILYHLPDHPGVLQTYVWQKLDVAPRFPELRKFLDFWTGNIEGRLHSVLVGHRTIIGPGEFRHAQASFMLN